MESKDTETRTRITILEEKSQRNDDEIAALQSRLTLLTEEIAILRSAVAKTQQLSGEVSTLKTQFSKDIGELKKDVSTLKTQFSKDIGDLRKEVPTLKTQFSRDIGDLRKEVSALKAQIVGIPSPPSLDSLIISDFPAIFADFRTKKFSLLWRGSRDSFKSASFHGRCDGHSNTLIVILDTNGNIFGGFTPVEWDSRGDIKADDSLKSFLFTLKNPRNIQPKRFVLKAEEKRRAIFCDYKWGPYFYDIGIANDCNTNNTSFADDFGLTYINDTGVRGGKFFTGQENFRVNEIEVFEITD
jgi:hypothetical protein